MITLQDLKTRATTQGFNYTYGKKEGLTAPPYLVAYANNSINFTADNKVYKKITTIQLDYIYSKKDITEQNKIEDNILEGVAWDKDNETYLEDEDCFLVSYYFEIIGG